MPHTLLQAKLQTPRLEHPLVIRPGLLQRIEAGAEGAITLIVAPAGYGKTTLAAQWAEQTETAVAWLSLDANDNDLAHFLTTVVAALRTVHPTACKILGSVLDRSPLPDTERLALLLGNEIDLLPARCVLVLDDYHHATDHAIQRLLGELLHHPPRRLHLLLITRSQPALALGRLRAGRKLTEIGVHDLRFTEQETAALLAQKWETAPSEQFARALCARTEGWVAGLHLMTLSPPAADALAASAFNDAGANQYVAEYLLEQVLQQQPPLVRDFLLKSSILERFTPALAAAITGIGQEAGGVSLPDLARAGLFLNNAADAGEWCSHHALFRDLLQQQLAAYLPPGEIAVLHRRAAAWFFRHGYDDEALRHALAAGDHALTVQIVVEHSGGWLEREHWRTVERRLNLLPAALLDQHPWLLMLKAQTLRMQLKWVALHPLLVRAEQQLADGACELTPHQEQLLRGHLDSLWALHWGTITDAPRAIAAAQQALRLLPEGSGYVRGSLQLALTLALQSDGSVEMAEQMLAAALAQAELSVDSDRAALHPLLCLTSLAYAGGNLQSAVQVARLLLHKATATGSQFNQLVAHLALGAAAYELNELEAAAEHFAQGVRLGDAGNARGGHECLVGLALTRQAQGRGEAAAAVLAQLNTLHIEQGSSALAAEAITLQRRLALVEGGGPTTGLDAALRRSVPPEMSIWFGWLEIPTLTALRVALAAPPAATQAGKQPEKHAQDLSQLEETWNQLWACALRLHKPVVQTALLAAKALLLHRRRQDSAAIAALRESLALGQRHGLVRSIADTGPALAPLLAELAALQPSPYLERVRAAIARPDARWGGGEERRFAPGLAAPLTRREREVLLLLGQYRTDREIAETLVISTVTVRTHIENLSSKLAVSGRRAIVNRARAHGLLA